MYEKQLLRDLYDLVRGAEDGIKAYDTEEVWVCLAVMKDKLEAWNKEQYKDWGG